MDPRQSWFRQTANASNTSSNVAPYVAPPSQPPRVPVARQAAPVATSTAPQYAAPVSAPPHLVPAATLASRTTTHTMDETTRKETSEKTSLSKSTSRTVTVVTEEISSELFSLARPEVNGSSKHFLESTVSALHTELETILKVWKEERLYATLDEWIKSRIVQHVKKIETTAVTDTVEKHKKEIRETEEKHRRKIVEVTEIHEKEKKSAVANAVRKTWAKYEAKMAALRVQMTLHFEAAAMMKEWGSEVEAFASELSGLGPKDFKPVISDVISLSHLEKGTPPQFGRADVLEGLNGVGSLNGKGGITKVSSPVVMHMPMTAV